MKSDNDNSWLDPLLSRQVQHEPGEFDFARWAQEHPEEARLLAQGFAGAGRNQETPTCLIWRCFMGSKITRYSAAAVIALAAALVLLGPWGTTKNGGVALAAVQEKVAQVNTMVMRGERIFTNAADPNIVFRLEITKYVSRQYGYTEEGRIQGTLLYRLTLNRPEQQCLVLFPAVKKCLKHPCTEGQIEVLEKLTPTGVMDQLVETDYRRLGPATIDGMAVEGFEFQGIKPVQNILPKYLFDMQDGQGTVWVATKELLPVRMEGDLLIGKCLGTLFTEQRVHEVCALESYDVPLDEGLFSPEIPAGYTQFQLSDVLSMKLSLADLGVLPAGTGPARD